MRAAAVPEVAGVDDVIRSVTGRVFGMMIDSAPGGLRAWSGQAPAFVDPTAAWVDVDGARRARILLTCEWVTAARMTRGLLGLGPTEPVDAADVVDAFGEVANVLGGNLRSLLPDPGALSLPQVARRGPERPAAEVDHEVVLDWRGDRLVVALHRLD